MENSAQKPVTGIVFDVKKCSLHDGPGIRTTVFLKGCPLKCLWCHNPESMNVEREISYQPEKCIGCSSCVPACKMGCHALSQETGHVFTRKDCIRCGACVAACYMGALSWLGERIDAETIVLDVVKDREYFEKSGGGLTVSGGEPMLQAAFTADILKRAKQHGLHTCLDTCGYVPEAKYRDVLDCVDLFLYDIKETDTDNHREYTGVDNRLILENLFILDSAGARIILRCPIIPGLNDRGEHFASIANIANRLKNVVEIHVLPFHPYGGNKGERVGRTDPLAGWEAVKEEQTIAWIASVQKHTKVMVKKG